MRLTSFTDYCLRALIYVALKGGGGYTIADLLKPGRNLARLLALPQPGDRP